MGICDSSLERHVDPAEDLHAQPVSAEWIKRAYVPEDESALVYLWCKSYMRSLEGVERGCYNPYDRGDAQKSVVEVREAQRQLWAEQAPLVEVLLRRADVEVLCDPERVYASEAGPAVIWGFACTSGDTIHYVCVKRDAVKVGLGPEMVQDLLGSRLQRPCWFTHDLVEMRTGSCGVKLPRTWGWDSLWLARWLVGHRRVAGEHESVRAA